MRSCSSQVSLLEFAIELPESLVGDGFHWHLCCFTTGPSALRRWQLPWLRCVTGRQRWRASMAPTELCVGEGVHGSNGTRLKLGSEGTWRKQLHEKVTVYGLSLLRSETVDGPKFVCRRSRYASNDGSKRTVSESPETVRNEKWRNGVLFSLFLWMTPLTWFIYMIAWLLGLRNMVCFDTQMMSSLCLFGSTAVISLQPTSLLYAISIWMPFGRSFSLALIVSWKYLTKRTWAWYMLIYVNDIYTSNLSMYMGSFII